MTSNQKELNGPLIWRLLEKVDSNLRGHFTEVLIVGGAALSIHWMIQQTHERGTFDVDVVHLLPQPSERTTRSVDSLTIPLPYHLDQAVQAVARREDLGVRWLNNDARGSIPPISDLQQEMLFRGKNLHVYRPSLPVLLAMKLTAHRLDKDLEDTIKLAIETGITEKDEMLKLLEDTYGPGHINSDIREFINKATNRIPSRYKPENQISSRGDNSDLDL